MRRLTVLGLVGVFFFASHAIAASAANWTYSGGPELFTGCVSGASDATILSLTTVLGSPKAAPEPTPGGGLSACWPNLPPGGSAGRNLARFAEVATEAGLPWAAFSIGNPNLANSTAGMYDFGNGDGRWTPVGAVPQGWGFRTEVDGYSESGTGDGSSGYTVHLSTGYAPSPGTYTATSTVSTPSGVNVYQRTESITIDEHSCG